MLFPSGTDHSLIEFIDRFAITFAIVGGSAVLYLLICRGLSSLESHQRLPAQLMQSLRKMIRWLVGVAMVVIVLQSLGVLQSVFAAVTGVFALLAIGFVAVWSVLSNMLCSLILMIVRPFRVGDVLSFPPDNWGGRVVNFNMLFTTLEAEDGFLLQVPNNTFFQRPLLRKKGARHIGLGDQLYRTDNARLDTLHRPDGGHAHAPDPARSAHGERQSAAGTTHEPA